MPTTDGPPNVDLNKDLQHSGICVNTQASEEPGNSMGRWRKSLLSSRPKAGNWPTQTLTLNSNLSLISYSTSSILAPNIFRGKKSFQVLLTELAVQRKEPKAQNLVNRELSTPMLLPLHRQKHCSLKVVLTGENRGTYQLVLLNQGHHKVKKQ